MNYHDAMCATVSLAEAVAELRRHGVTATVADDGTLSDQETGERIAEPLEADAYEGADIIGFLGY